MVGGGYFVNMGLCKFKHSASADLNSDDTFENVFLFPDFRTALVGDFCPIKRVIMEKAFPGKITLGMNSRNFIFLSMIDPKSAKFFSTSGWIRAWCPVLLDP